MLKAGKSNGGTVEDRICPLNRAKPFDSNHETSGKAKERRRAMHGRFLTCPDKSI